jgi:hypothetical protein
MNALILEYRPAATLGAVPLTRATGRVCLVVFGRLSGRRHRFICRWCRDANGQLTCFWEPDIGPTPLA